MYVHSSVLRTSMGEVPQAQVPPCDRMFHNNLQLIIIRLQTDLLLIGTLCTCEHQWFSQVAVHGEHVHRHLFTK